MTLPQMDRPTYFVDIPSTGKQIKFKPFSAGEQKILLIALQENDPNVVFEAVKQIIENCTFNQVNVDKLTTYDLEYLFLQTRIKSKGSTTALSFRCENKLEDGETCDHINTIDFDLEQAKVEGETGQTKKIILEEKSQTGIVLKVPTFESAKNIHNVVLDNEVEGIYKSLPFYVDTIFQGETVYDDFTEQELQKWIEDLSDSQFALIQEFFNDLPRVRATIPIKCESCGYEEEIVLEGLSNFLD